jgi:hypothetical protein
LIRVDEALLFPGEALEAAPEALLFLLLMKVHSRVGVAVLEAGAQQRWLCQEGADMVPDGLLDRCGGQASARTA